MSLLIDVGTVLRGTVCDLYSNLLTRPTGAAVRNAIERQVVEFGIPVVTTIDFSQVELLDFSCADEIVAKLLMRYAQDDGPLAGYLLFRGIRDDHRDAIEAVLSQRRLALIAWHDGFAELHGIVDEDERTHWEAVRDNGPVDVETVARELERDPTHVQRLLDRLWRRRLVMHGRDGFLVPGMVGPAT